MFEKAKAESGKSSIRARQQAAIRQSAHALDAVYVKEGLLPEHAENPLISCLGQYWTMDDIAREVSVPVGFEESERSRSREYRMHAISRLDHLVVSLPAHLSVVDSVHRIIRQHYSHQSIADNGLESMRDRYTMSNEGQLRAVYQHEKSHASCCAFFGLSGSGKSTAVESALRLLPKVIRHKETGVMQVVRIKIDCPRNAGLKDTLKLIILTFDELLGTNYTGELSARATVADYANKVHRISKRHFVGVIVLDEIQNALHAAAKSQDPLFDFFVNFTNIVRTPVIVCGTPRAERLFRKTLRLARRVSSQGVTVWRGIQNPSDWDRFCNKLSMYQWLQKAQPLTESERKCLWELTQGLPGVAVPLFQLAQYAAIETGKEQLSNEVFKMVFKEKMSALQPILAAIRSGKKAAMMKFDDVLGDTMKDVVDDMRITAQHNLFYNAAINHDRIETNLDAVSCLIASGIPGEIASSMVGLLQKQHPNATREQLCYEVNVMYYKTKDSRLKFANAGKVKPETAEVAD